MKLFFGAAKTGAAAQKPVSEALQQLRETIDMQQKRQKHLQMRVDKELVFIKANAKNNKRAALMALQRKKLIEKQLCTIDQIVFNLEQQSMTLENTSLTSNTLDAMKSGNKALKEIHKSMNISDVDELADDLKDTMQDATDITNAMAAPLEVGDPVDPDDLEAELDGMLADDLGVELEAIGTESRPPAAPPQEVELPVIPSPPVNIPRQKVSRPVVNKTEEDELAELAAMMAM